MEDTKKSKGQVLRVRLRSFDNRLADQASAEIVDAVKRSGTHARGPVPLPTVIERFSVNRSPHKDKKSAEQFELKTHKRMIDIIDPSADTMEALKKINLPSGVEIVIASQQ
ncbi:MAG: 30S ribosomal protein S10 [Puniceicoccales bacterium]|jgi:small subunit ribosomal protein S10|nr:30S ribosomal protein S10 [Puniceicoccales bacterium]